MAEAPSSAATPRYRADDGATLLRSDVFDRAAPGLIAALAPWLGQLPGAALEIGAGTGQMAAACARAFPALAWWPSDPDPVHRASCTAWAAELRVPARAPIDLDASGDWPALPAVAALGPLSAVYSSNVIHITPWAVAEGIVAGAGRTLAPGGLLIFSGPFKVHGRDIGSGNVSFDAQLRARDPDWGIRDVADIEALAEAAGLGFAALQALPANNRLLVLRRTPAA